MEKAEGLPPSSGMKNDGLPEYPDAGCLDVCISCKDNPCLVEFTTRCPICKADLLEKKDE